MFNLCISELSDIVEGDVRLGAMPPLAGVLEPIGRIVVDVHQVGNRDVFWSLKSHREQNGFLADEAYLRGASGVVLQARGTEPWAGKFCVTVSDSVAALHRLVRCVRQNNRSWLRQLFGQDDVTQAALQALRQNDIDEITAIQDRLDEQLATIV